jgi:hypothetical protein
MALAKSGEPLNDLDHQERFELDLPCLLNTIVVRRHPERPATTHHTLDLT